MPAELSEKELGEFREIFNLVDNTGSGRITQQQLRNLMEVLRLRPTEEELDEMFVEARGLVTNTGTGSGAAGSGGGGGAPSSATANPSGANAKAAITRNSNGESTIDFNQFVSIMSKRVQSEYTPEQLRSAFKLFETEDLPIGVVSTEVLEHALMTYGAEKLTQEEAGRLLAAVDPEGTGKVNYLDFVALVTGEDR